MQAITGRSRLLLCASAAALLSTGALAQTSDAPQTDVEEIVVVGSQIVGSKITAASPVTVISAEQIGTTGTLSGDDLFRTIPQMGDVSFNPTNGATSSNFARGDVGSINLRNLGVGNTLVLLNGRRLVAHPTSQAENLTPAVTYNSNAIPVAGLARLEILRDGAAALYGSDAVAGVVNNVLQSDFDGLTVEARYGGAEGTNLNETEFNVFAGKNFHDGRGNVSVFVNYVDRSELSQFDQPYSSRSDKRPLFVGTRMEGLAGLDGGNNLSAWANLRTPQSFGTVRQGATALTTAGGQFHIQPTANGGCQVVLANGICIDDGTRATATGGADRNTRLGLESYDSYLIPQLERVNVFLTGSYELTEDVELYGELGYYRAVTHNLADPAFTIGSTKITIPATNYYNPFGPIGSPNRLANLNVPAAGLPVTLFDYRFVDMGPTNVDVTNDQARYLVGARGKKFGFNWDSAIVYSTASVNDVQDGVSSTALQRQLGLATPDAYNPFNGGDPANPMIGDTTRSSQAAIDAIRIKSSRRGETSMFLWDFKISRPDLFQIWGGDVGVATGVEYRRETASDDRDDRVDGTIKFTDVVTGEVQDADLFGVSPSPDTKGKREVAAAFLEFAIPLVSPEMSIPFVRSLEAQVAGRYEHYSDFGSVAKPRVAAAWDIVDGLRIRGSWAQGFRAPNLETINASIVTRGNSRTDWVYCEADLRAGRISSFAACSGRAAVTTARRAGNPDLDAETSESWTVGVVLQPRFIPEQYGDFTITADWWDVQQKGIVGVFGEGNALIVDYLERVQGRVNPAVVRREPTPEEVALFAGTGLAPAGQVIYADDMYQNLEPQFASGADFSFNWRKQTERFGRFNLSVNAAYLHQLYRRPSAQIQALIDARAAGVINPGITITEGGSLVGEGGRPEWKGSASLNWTYKDLGLGWFTQYTDAVRAGLTDAQGVQWVVASQVTHNATIDYQFRDGWKNNTRLRLGVRNVFDKDPPLATGDAGYLGALYQPYGRYWYASIRKTF
ncbi:TonB-dependent receptor [Caulobacter segnis]|uniref:TonB-dependent receptor domain-containing protein n=1 Tax=Caulobacter segnis TaxID=88688 RepID=UPI00240F26DD|nr:TonB-dependent receptor [Caulobacter segnis]MDG2522940.1 TonB-dependent receptor [Caulobacter segnis]